MRTRNSEWIDTKTLDTFYGVQIFKDGQWMNVSVDGERLLFANKEDRDAARQQIRKSKGEEQ